MASTEEETFKRLKRLPYNEMRALWSGRTASDAKEFRQFCLDHHWTVEEWFDEMYDEMIRDNGNENESPEAREAFRKVYIAWCTS